MTRRNTKKVRSATSLMAVAIHEAGHAVAMHYGNFRWRCVTIDPEPGGGGQCSVYGLSRESHNKLAAGLISPHLRYATEGRILAAFAGALAGQRYTGEFYNYGFTGATKAGQWLLHGSDADTILEYIHCLSDSQQEERLYFRLLRCRARTTIVNRPERWAAIQALARVLARRKHLECAEAQEIIVEAIRRFRLQSQKMKAKLV